MLRDERLAAPELVVYVEREPPQEPSDGVREAWVIEPGARTIRVLVVDAGQYVQARSVSLGEAIPSDLAPVGSGGLLRPQVR